MKKLSMLVLLSGIVGMQACNSGSSNDSVAKADSANDVKDTTSMMAPKDTVAGMGVNDDVADFAVKAANAGMTEIKMGEYEVKHASDKSVKDYASMLVKDHTKAGDELKSIAKSKNITLPAMPGSDNMDMMTDLMKKTGKDFDKAYMNQMVKDHKDAVDLFQKAADNSKDSDMKTFAANTLPVLQKHLNDAEAIVKSHNY